MKPGDKYYDGPVADTGRTIKEIEKDIEEETERLKKLKWTPDMLNEWELKKHGSTGTVLFSWGGVMKYRKKLVVIEAYQTDKPMDIETLEGTMHASPGDYIITGVNGEQYPCKPDIFKKTYEAVE